MVSTALLRDIKKSISKISTDDGNLARFNLFNIDQYVENTLPCAKKTRSFTSGEPCVISTWRMKSAFHPFIQQVWLRSKERTGQYQFDDHATSSS